MDLERNQSEAIENEASHESLLSNQKDSFKRKITGALGVFAIVAGLHVTDAIKDNINSGNGNEMDQDEKVAFIENQRAEADANTRHAKIVRAIRIEE